MTAKRMTVIVWIYLLACGGWVALGMTTQWRSAETTGRLGSAVKDLWGRALIQAAPLMEVDTPGNSRKRVFLPAATDVTVELETDYRRKGLIWYPTYRCCFDGAWTLRNDEEVAQKVRLHFAFPTVDGTYDRLAILVDGQPVTSPVDIREGVREILELAPGQELRFCVTYATRGIGEWRYQLGMGSQRVHNLNLEMATNFTDVDFPEGCLSPMAMEKADGGMLLRWQANDLITSENIGVVVPEKLNPGPLTSRITFFAPVCLVFFFVLVAAIQIISGINIHPMHYLFVAAGFFAFHLLLDYMAGLVNIHLAFIVSAAVSVVLVTSYLSAALRGQFPWKAAVGGQSFFLVLFSYSFFLKGVTGLTVAIGSVVTLAVLMRMTAHIDWDEVFRREERAQPKRMIEKHLPPEPETTPEG